MKVDLKKTLKEQYSVSAKAVSIIKIPAQKYVIIDGSGDPNDPNSQKAIQTLYPVVYTLKFQKKEVGEDFTVMPLEAVWWADDMNDFLARKKNTWKWTYMILVPDFVTKADVAKALATAMQKGKIDSNGGVYFLKTPPERSAQLLHKGPFDAEGPNIAKIHEHIVFLGKKLSGKHHEIYLSDPRKSAPEKLKTILRQSFE
jgi:hypothetical protein